MTWITRRVRGRHTGVTLRRNGCQVRSKTSPAEMDTMLTLDRIREAAAANRELVHRTPVLESRLLSDAAKARLWLKCENFQKTGSFKARGAANRIRKIPAARLGRGVVTVSAGNHAQAVAWAAAAVGTPSIVCMPSTAPSAKIDASREYGATVRLEPDADAAFATALELARTEGYEFVHPFDHVDVCAGQGTVGLELMEQVDRLTDVIVPVGGGGLISGVARAVRSISPQCRVWGVEPVGAAAMRAALEAGEPRHLEAMETIADGLAAPFAGALPLSVVRTDVTDVVTVTDDSLREAMRLFTTRAKIVVEPAGAAGLAALLEGSIRPPPGARVGVVVSGGNLDLAG